LQNRREIHEDLEWYVKARWMTVIDVLGSVTILMFVFVSLLALIGPSDVLIPVKVTFVFGYAIVVAFLVSRVLQLFDSESDIFDRLIALVLLPVSLLAIFAAVQALPDIVSFLLTAVVIVQFSHVSVYVKAILAVGMIVVAVVPAIRFHTGLLYIGGATLQIRLDRKKLRGETSP